MAYPGQVLHNPLTHETFTFIKTTHGTGGDSLLFNCHVTPGGARLMPHVHETQEERFRVRSGKLGVMLGGKKHILGSGEGIILPAKVKHQWWVAGDEPVEFLVEAVPAGNLEGTLEAIAAMAAAGALNKRAMPKNPFRLAALGAYSETFLPVIPIWAQKIGLTMGVLTGRMFGVDPTFADVRAVATPAVQPVPLAARRAAGEEREAA